MAAKKAAEATPAGRPRGEDVESHDGAQSPRDRAVYRMSEGVRLDLEMYGETTDPVTGERLTK